MPDIERLDLPILALGRRVLCGCANHGLANSRIGFVLVS
jgi:hypothetical protein